MSDTSDYDSLDNSIIKYFVWSSSSLYEINISVPRRKSFTSIVFSCLCVMPLEKTENHPPHWWKNRTIPEIQY